MNDNDFFILLGTELKKLRSKNNFTLKQVSDYSGISISYLSAIELGEKQVSLSYLRTLCEFYEVELWKLIKKVTI
ncbi:helix-turn-helix transcriptional regulator [Halobacteriovorax sp. GB3]|uniref:helix-turn-helix domain-containing protein n=1 Tax=Halobacteriovorax sp. GB3 TaxID=2719615 RepID=UPI00235FEE5C|nr:helix-turn-helix transcriptional regulator [Halobacteriovorax sp. GB3]MDD0853016.1 helix-turn-helix transcriptional regulator [Halobacteriovorax sp. GB3]